MYKLSDKSIAKLKGVHPDLVYILKIAIESGIIDFSVSEGVRTIETQKEYVAKGVSKTLNSKHLIQPDGYGHAVDLYPYPIDMVKVNKGNAQEVAKFGVLAGVIKSVAKNKGIDIIWGGDWKSFVDMPHFELRKGK